MTKTYPASSVQLVADLHCDLGESPSWVGNTNKLLAVDINLMRIFIYDGKDTETIQLREKVGAVLPSDKPGVLVALLEKDIVSIDVSDAQTQDPVILATTPADHGLPHEGYRFNDAKASPGGRLIAGRMHNNWRGGTPGKVYSFSSDNRGLQQILSDDRFFLPNGMAWDEQKSVMYYADTGANTIYKYPTDAEGVPIGGQQSVAFKLSQDDFPDGITIDADGNVWVALAEHGQIACFSPTGEELHVIELPVKRPTAITFGGKDLSTLFITTRAESGEGACPHAGGIFSTTVDGIRGAAAAYPFKLG